MGGGVGVYCLSIDTAVFLCYVINITKNIKTMNNLLKNLTIFGRKPIAFEPIPIENDDDELARAVNDPIYHDNHWSLRDDVDSEALGQFWDDTAKDLEANQTAKDK